MTKIMPGNYINPLYYPKNEYTCTIPGMRFYEVIGYGRVTTTLQTSIPLYVDRYNELEEKDDAVLKIPTTGTIYEMKMWLDDEALIHDSATGTVRFDLAAGVGGPLFTAVATKIAAKSVAEVKGTPWAASPTTPLGAGTNAAFLLTASGNGVKAAKSFKIHTKICFFETGD